MPNPYDYGWEKLFHANSLLCGPGLQSERLKRAIRCFKRLNPENQLPKEIREEFFDFEKRMKAVKPKNQNQSPFDATIDTFSDEEVQKAVEQINTFYDTVCRYKQPRNFSSD